MARRNESTQELPEEPERRPMIPRASLAIALAAAFAGIAGLAGLAAFAETKTPEGVVTYDAREIAEAFSKGKLVAATGEYKIAAGHRTEAGEPEVHETDTDIFYVVAGQATFVTGGKVVDPRIESPGETRGARIEGGRPQALKKGDVIIIPRGVPHWFSEVAAPTDYFVVKVTAAGAKAAKGAEKK
jgi:mannose-6-phosphate isomerase-like protein (cupin superfamily)